MSNAGLIPGLNADGWRRYNATFACAGGGGETQPVLIAPTVGLDNPFGRYIIVDKTIVVVEIQVGFVGVGFSVGAGAAYVFSLPFPALRWSGEAQTAPIPLGIAMSYLSFQDPQVNVPGAVTLADPHASLNGQEDNYVQVYHPYVLSWGSATIASGTVTVTHRCGFAPRAEDIEIIPLDLTNISSSAGMFSVQNITSTTFDVKQLTSTSGNTFAWKVRSKPLTGSTGPLLSPTVPWDWTRANTLSPFGNMFLQFAYEPKR